MCGICGVLIFERERCVPRSALECMNRQIVHRGPDDEGFFVSGNVGLAMRRLSIIDLQTGDQPVTNEERTVWLVYNGEIYNYKDLRAQLLERGHLLRTHSDTETIVHLYEEYGPDCVQHLRGMFAFALWDQPRRRLLVARDRLGIKPLYYRLTDHEFIFGSEIKAILEYPGTKREFNRAVLPEYLAFGYLSGRETFFSGIQCLPPGHYLELDESGAGSPHQYWELPPPESGEERDEQFYIRRYRELLEECVASHLMSDVPLGMFLSGGLDSSAVAALATKAGGKPLQTFAVGYEEAPFSELSYARTVAEHIGSQHHEVVMRREDFFGALPLLIWHEDKPITWPSSVSLYFVARLAREHVTVVLTGEGSDETLAGYSRYPFTVWNSRFNSVYRYTTPASFRRAVRKAITDSRWLSADLRRKLQHTFLGRDGDSWASLYLDNFLCSFSQTELRELLAGDFSAELSGGPYDNSLRFWGEASGDLLSRILFTDIKTYLVELLMKQDRMSMAASVESRVPFLDHVLVEFALKIPSRFKTKGLSGKHVLKSAMRGLLPEGIIYRRKMGFPTPWRSWLQGPQFPWVEQTLSEPRSLARGLFKPEGLHRLLQEHRLQRTDHTDRLWRLLNLEIWQRVFMDGEGSSYVTGAEGLRLKSVLGGRRPPGREVWDS